MTQDSPDSAAAPTAPSEPPKTRKPLTEEQLSSVHTTNFPDLLRRLQGCLLVSTYQAGKLVILRPDGAAINTHFRGFNRPMGMVADRNQLVLGARMEIARFRNVPAVAPKLQDPPRHDAVYMARGGHITGAIDIHELVLDGEGRVWFVNTLFSCLCTLDEVSSFVPRWRPWFVSHYSPEDRCHLNGLAVRDGVVRYVTALGESNEPGGWRVNKRDGGLLIDCVENRVIVRGLSMPHSPRWHDGKLWVLESGRGALVQVDPDTGEKTDVAFVPGFARGMDFLGPVAFIGLSQLRETNAFTDIPITEENKERLSGVWAVNIETGKTIAFLKFTGGVQEIFAVAAVQGVLFPEIVHEGELLTSTYALPEAALREAAPPRPRPPKPEQAGGSSG